MSEEAKESHFVSSGVLTALEDASLWGVEDREKGEGIFKHVLLASRVAYCLAKELKEKKIAGYEEIDLELVVVRALLHDIDKLYIEDREGLASFEEISHEAEKRAIDRLKELGFSKEVYEAPKGQDLPQEIIDDPYWKTTIVADYMTGQKVMSIEERLDDIKKRWITQRQSEGKSPRMTLEEFERAKENIEKVAEEIFGYLGTTDKEFIEKYRLNDEASITRWEKFLMRTREKGKEKRALLLVKALIS